MCFFQKVAGVVFTVGGLASGAKGLMDVVKGATPGQVWISVKKKIFKYPAQTIIAGLEAVGSIFGENVNKEIAKLVAQVQISISIKSDFVSDTKGAGKVLSGTVTSVFGGVTMLWDMYQVIDRASRQKEI